MSIKTKKNRQEKKETSPDVIYHETTQAEGFNVLSIPRDVFDIVFGWNLDFGQRLFKSLLLVVFRAYVIFSFQKNDIFYKIESFLCVNFVGQLIMFAIVFYLGFYVLSTVFLMIYWWNFALSNDSNISVGFSEIDKFKNWRDNKMKFMSYKDSAQLMSDTSSINNLEQNSNHPETKKTLDYINNKMRFMSYPDAVKFLRGDKK
jgi:hypothetical protein